MTVRKRLLVLGLVAGLCVGHSVAVRPADSSVFDQRLIASALDEMRGGKGFYDAYIGGSAEVGVHASQPRSVRLPTAFLLWRAVPGSALFGLYLVVVVGGTALALTFATRRALPVLAVALYLLHAGNIWTPSGGTTEEWLLVELWAVPALAVALAASRRGRWWLAAGAGAVATLVRELVAPLLLTGLVAAHLRRTSRTPWLAATAAVIVGISVHWIMAWNVTVPPGNEARLRGTASFPRSVLAIVDWPLPGPYLLGVAAFAVSVVWLARSGELVRWSGLLALPLAGLFVGRPYWGLVLVPFTVFWASELACEEIARFIASKARP